jgi:hypothetical protein
LLKRSTLPLFVAVFDNLVTFAENMGNAQDTFTVFNGSFHVGL